MSKNNKRNDGSRTSVEEIGSAAEIRLEHLKEIDDKFEVIDMTNNEVEESIIHSANNSDSEFEFVCRNEIMAYNDVSDKSSLAPAEENFIGSCIIEDAASSLINGSNIVEDVNNNFSKALQENLSESCIVEDVNSSVTENFFVDVNRNSSLNRQEGNSIGTCVNEHSATSLINDNIVVDFSSKGLEGNSIGTCIIEEVAGSIINDNIFVEVSGKFSPIRPQGNSIDTGINDDSARPLINEILLVDNVNNNFSKAFLKEKNVERCSIEDAGSSLIKENILVDVSSKSSVTRPEENAIGTYTGSLLIKDNILIENFDKNSSKALLKGNSVGSCIIEDATNSVIDENMLVINNKDVSKKSSAAQPEINSIRTCVNEDTASSVTNENVLVDNVNNISSIAYSEANYAESCIIEDAASSSINENIIKNNIESSLIPAEGNCIGACIIEDRASSIINENILVYNNIDSNNKPSKSGSRENSSGISIIEDVPISFINKNVVEHKNDKAVLECNNEENIYSKDIYDDDVIFVPNSKIIYIDLINESNTSEVNQLQTIRNQISQMSQRETSRDIFNLKHTKKAQCQEKHGPSISSGAVPSVQNKPDQVNVPQNKPSQIKSLKRPRSPNKSISHEKSGVKRSTDATYQEHRPIVSAQKKPNQVNQSTNRASPVNCHPRILIMNSPNKTSSKSQESLMEPKLIAKKRKRGRRRIKLTNKEKLNSEPNANRSETNNAQSSVSASTNDWQISNGAHQNPFKNPSCPTNQIDLRTLLNIPNLFTMSNSTQNPTKKTKKKKKFHSQAGIKVKASCVSQPKKQKKADNIQNQNVVLEPNYEIPNRNYDRYDAIPNYELQTSTHNEPREYAIIDNNSLGGKIWNDHERALEQAFVHALTKFITESSSVENCIQIDEARFKNHIFVFKLMTPNHIDSLRAMIHSMPPPWRGSQLLLIPHWRKTRMSFRVDGAISKISTAEIMQMLCKQNPGLQINKWENVVRNSFDDETTIFAMDVDNNSLSVLKQTNYRAYVNCITVYFEEVNSSSKRLNHPNQNYCSTESGSDMPPQVPKGLNWNCLNFNRD